MPAPHDNSIGLGSSSETIRETAFVTFTSLRVAAIAKQVSCTSVHI